MTILDPLMQPFACKSFSAPNRFAMAPMSRYFAPGGILTQESIDYYRRRVEGGVGTIITEGVAVDRPNAVATDTIPRFSGEEGLAAWEKAAGEIKAAGGTLVPQLWHVGGCIDFNYPDAPHEPLESPSGIVGPDQPGGRPMTIADIDAVIAAFVRGAVEAKARGMNAVELHGAHGYLFDQFFWEVTNKRDDRYGGPDIADRAAFAADVVAAIRQAVGPDYAIIFRISQWKTYLYDAKIARDPQELERWLTPLVDAGVDIFHCSDRRFWEPVFADGDYNLAGWTKKVTGKPTVTVGSVGLDRDLLADFASGESTPNMKSLDELERRFDRGDFDIVAIGRVLLADPHWLEKVRAGRFGELEPYSVKAVATLY